MIDFFVDTSCDFTKDFLKNNKDINIIEMPLYLDGVQILFAGKADDDESVLDFYTELSIGKKATTSAINPQTFKEAFEKSLKKGYDVLYLAFSSAMSSTYKNAVSACDELKEKYNDRKIAVIDSLSGTAPMGLIAEYAHSLIKEGKTIEEVVALTENYKKKIRVFFVVNDLNFLKRGGRISALIAIVGSLLKIKPILTLLPNGTIDKFANVMGYKTAISFLSKQIEAYGENAADHDMSNVHSNAPEKAEQLKSLIRGIVLEKVGKNIDISIVNLSPAMGAHIGPGGVAIAFHGHR